MRRFVALLLSVVLGLVPFAGMARQASMDSQGVQDMPCHQVAPKADLDADGDCDSCDSASLCCAIFVPPAALPGTVGNSGAFQIPATPDLSAGVVLPPLDPPPPRFLKLP